MMGATEKSPTRVAIEADVVAHLQAATRPCSADELYRVCDAADDKVTMSRIIGHMREAGIIVRDADIAPGEPGGMPAKTKGSKAVASYRLPTDAERAQIDAATTEAAYASADALHQGAPSAFDTEYRPVEDLDTAASSTNGDESASPWARMLAEGCQEDHQWESDLLQACEASREALITIADQLLAGHPIWTAVRSVDRSLQRLADDYV